MTDYIVNKLENYVEFYNKQPNDVLEKSKHRHESLYKCELIVIAMLDELGYRYDKDKQKYITQAEAIINAKQDMLQKGREKSNGE